MSTTPSPNKATKSKIDYLFSQQKNPTMETDLAEDKKILLKNLTAGENFAALSDSDTSSDDELDASSTVSDTSSNADTVDTTLPDEDTGNSSEDDEEVHVTAVVALISNKAESKASSSRKHLKKSQRSNLIRVLLDTGSDGDLWFQEKGTPLSFPYLARQVPKSWHTSNGTFHTKGRGEVNLKFCEYSNSKEFLVKPDIVEYDQNKMTKPAFDLILGVESLKKLGIVLDFRTSTITIDEIILPMRNIDNLSSKHKIEKAWSVNNSMLQEPLSTLDATNRVVRILDAKYEKADLQSIIKENCKHLSQHDQNKLLDLLNKFEDLFDGTLGDWKTEPVSFELKEGAKPYHGRAFPVPKIHKATLIKELNRLCDLGVLMFQPASEWAAPSFIIPKKDMTVRFISDFREVNKRIVRKPFPIPKISTVLQEMEGFTFATALDLNMGYYTIRLDPDATKICTIIFPWGKYSYLRLPMGVAGSPDIFQSKMSELMATLEFVKTYLDDLLCITRGDLDDHLDKLKLVLQRLQDANLKVNARKSNFCAIETEYLGYILSRDGIKPQPKKVQSILALLPPTNVKQLRRFLGMVQYYRDLWARRSEMLAPLTSLVGECGHTKDSRKKKVKKKPWHWDEVHQQAFDNVKAAIARDVTLAYPDYDQEFEIYTDGSKTQLGAVITQNNRPIAFFSRKLTETQQKYSVTEIELLAIVETLKEFKGMLWGQKIKIYTDHKNLIQDALGLNSDRVYRWRLLLEEYGPEIVHIKGTHNTVADALSRLDYGPVRDDKDNWMTFNKCLNFYIRKSDEIDDDSLSETYEEKMNFVFANSSEDDAIYPLTVPEIAEAQEDDKSLDKLSKKKDFSYELIEDVKVLCKDGKLVIPKKLQHRAVAWYHHYLQHPGSTRLEETLRSAMYWKGMRRSVRAHVKKCHKCQVNKRRKHKYGKLPTKLVVTKPWDTLCVDLIGPYTLKGKDGTIIDFMCVTMIDPATSWFEIVELPVSQLEELDAPTVGKKGKKKGKKSTHDKDNKPKEAYFDKSSATVGSLVNQCWFCRYPRCRAIIYDNGSEFKLHFETLCDTYGLKRKPTSIKNPQANSILERMHQVITTMLRTAELDMADTVAPSNVANFLTNAAWAVRSTYHTVLKASPGAAIFGRDMLFDIPFLADWNKIGEYRQCQTDRNTARENKSRIEWDYKVGDRVLIRKDGVLRKGETKYQPDPWTITTVHTNGTIRIQRGNKSERLNIRRVTPYFEE